MSHLLGWLWSPQQIARILRSMRPESRDMHVSHKTIHNATYTHPKGELRKEPIDRLLAPRQEHATATRGRNRLA